MRLLGSRSSWLVLAVILALVSGCSGRKATYQVKGKIVDEEDKPAVGALVFFHPANGQDQTAVRATGRTDDSGEYKLTTYVEGDGAPVGDYKVTIVWPEPRRTPFAAQDHDQLNGKLSDPDHPATTFTVQKGSNEVPTLTVPRPPGRK